MNVSKLRKISCCNHFLKFRYSHSAVARSDSEIELLPKQDAKVTKNIAGISVASVENYSPISRVCVLVKAGSRFEPGNNLGIAHCLRNCTALSTKNSSAFSITRKLELLGAKLRVASTREYILYTIQCSRDDIDSGLEVLADVTTQQAFKPWEVDDALPHMHIDLAIHQTIPEAVLMEALHKAAFRGGLRNSLYSLPFMIGKHSPDMLHDYVKKNFTSSNIAIAGLGLSHDNLENAAANLFDVSLPIADSTGASKFGGGEIRIESNVSYAQAAIVAEGASLANTKEMLSLGVLQCILGTGTHHKHSSAAFSKLGVAAAKCTNKPFTVSSLNINYSDTGLFGVHVAGHPDDMKLLVKSIVSQMRDVTKNLTEEEVQVAKHKLKTKLALERETSDDTLQEMAIEVSNFGRIRDVKELEKTIDSLTSSDISSMASKVMKTKPAMAALGPLHNTPHLDELI